MMDREKILNGYRGQPKLNVQSVADVLDQLSKLVVEHPEIAELDINPLLVTPENAIALDARIILRQMSDLESKPETLQLLSSATPHDGLSNGNQRN